MPLSRYDSWRMTPDRENDAEECQCGHIWEEHELVSTYEEGIQPCLICDDCEDFRPAQIGRDEPEDDL